MLEATRRKRGSAAPQSVGARTHTLTHTFALFTELDQKPRASPLRRHLKVGLFRFLDRIAAGGRY